MLRAARLLGIATAVVAGLTVPASAGAAGVVTHGLMAEKAIPHVQSPQLAALLRARRSVLVSGAAYPDGGYGAQGAPGSGYSEVTHWEGFVNAYAAHIRAKPGCGPLSAPAGPCASLVAHLMGVAAHGMGDETWDWLFEPRVTDHGEDPTHPNCHGPTAPVPLCSLIDSIEYAMDVVAIPDYDRWDDTASDPPPFDDLLAAYRAIGRDDVTREGIVAGQTFLTAAMAGERAGAAADSQRVRRQMPWSATHYGSEPGGIEWSARAIARYLDAVWAKLVGPAGAPPPPGIAAVHPAPGQAGVDTAWQPPRTSPGPHTGGGRLRVLAVLSNAVDPASISTDTFRLLDQSGAPVPALGGFPKAGPYHTSDGTHSLLFYPAVDLEPCERYTAVLTTGIRDRAGAPLPAAARWSFTTAGAACRPPPPLRRPPSVAAPGAADAGSPAARRPRARRCLPRRVRVGRRSLAGVALRARGGQVARRVGSPLRRRLGTWRWCVRGGGKAIAVFSRNGGALFAASTARGHRRGAARPGISLRTLKRIFRRAGLRRVRGQVYVVRRGSSRGLVLGVRGRRVRYIAVADRVLLRSPRLLLRFHRRAGFLKPRSR